MNQPSHSQYDYIIIGGGIIGLSTAYQLQQRLPDKRLLLLEKQSSLAYHQTGRNSGVIHAGVYYQPGSLKAQFCRQGAAATVAFCQQWQIPYQQCGKLIVATQSAELARLKDLFARCGHNNINCQWLTEQQLTALEPNIQGLAAIKIFATGITDYPAICRTMAELFIAAGGEVCVDQTVIGLTERPDAVTVTTQHSEINGQFIIACGGLMSDRLCQMMGIHCDFQIIPYRGEYYRLDAKHNHIVNHLIYPVPNPELPFLGVHLTKMIDGSITVGPNAVQGFKREGYGRFNVSLTDSIEMLSYPGFWQVAAAHYQSAIGELKDAWWKPGYLKRIRQYCPQLTLADLQPHPVGIRAQAVLKDGSLVHDFLFAHSPRSLHVCNAPSPGATSAMPIGQYIVAKVMTQQQTQ